MSSLNKNIKNAIGQLALVPYHWYCAIKEIPSSIKKTFAQPLTNKEFTQHYNNWLKKQALLGKDTQRTLEEKTLPTFSILLTVSSTSFDLFERSLVSYQALNYPKKELCISLIATNPDEFEDLKKKCLSFSSELNITQKPAHNEAEAFNLASELATNDYTFCIKSGDVIEPHCLTLVGKRIAVDPLLDVIYFDEGKINNKGLKHVPTFKPKWSPDLLLSHNYITAGVIFRSSLFHKLEKFDTNYTSAYLFDFLLKLTEHTDKIIHRSAVLFHKSSCFGYSTKIEEEVRSIEQALIRRGKKGEVLINDSQKGIYIIRYKLEQEAKISIIIPSRDQGEILANCLESIYQKTNYTNYEIIIIDNGSTEQLFFDVVKKWQEKLTITLLPLAIPFNFSRLNNLATKKASGDYLLFLNNDVEILTADWLTAMLEQAQRPSIGAVGAKLLFPNNEIQHAGVLLGIDGISTHPFAKKLEEDCHYYVNSIVNYTVLTGACLMMKKSVFEEVGGWDEDFVVEFNDFDLCLKLVNAGYNNVYLPHVSLYHYESYSRGKKHKHLEGFLRYRRERSLFWGRWATYIKNDPSYNLNLHKASDQIFKLNLD